MRCSPLGDRALLVHVGGTIDEATHRRVRAGCKRLTLDRLAGLVEIVPAFASVALHYDPARVPSDSAAVTSSYERFEALVSTLLTDLGEEDATPPRVVEIPVCYGGELGPDLDEVARHHSLAP